MSDKMNCQFLKIEKELGDTQFVHVYGRWENQVVHIHIWKDRYLTYDNMTVTPEMSFLIRYNQAVLKDDIREEIMIRRKF